MSDVTHPLEKVSRKVLEDWAMMLLDGGESSAERLLNDGQELFMCTTRFCGMLSGTVSIVAHTAFLQALYQNLLGSEEDAPHQRSDEVDALREMGNVLTGNFLTEAYGEEAEFDLRSPSVSGCAIKDVYDLLGARVVLPFTADDCPLIVTFSLDDGDAD